VQLIFDPACILHTNNAIGQTHISTEWCCTALELACALSTIHTGPRANVITWTSNNPKSRTAVLWSSHRKKEEC